MNTITAMSHIVDLDYKGKRIRLFMREKLGRHQAPYVIAKQPDNAEIHIILKTMETCDDTGFDTRILNFVKKWIKTHEDRLLATWATMKKTGKAPKIFQSKQIIKSWIRHVAELRTNAELVMILRMEDGEIRIVDFKKIIPKNPALAILKDPKTFMKAEAFGSGVRWEKVDIDLEVNDILEFSKPVNLKKLMETI